MAVLVVLSTCCCFPGSSNTVGQATAFPIIQLPRFHHAPSQRQHQPQNNQQQARRLSPLAAASRGYGPPLDESGRIEGLGDKQKDAEILDVTLQAQKQEFKSLLDQVLQASQPEHVPSLLAKHTELLLRINNGDVVAQVVQEILDEKSTASPNEEVELERVEQAMDMILTFAEDFVTTSQTLDQNNKQLLGKIIRCMTDQDGSERDREERLDELLATEKPHFTRGFLRHLEGEVERIAKAPTLTPESAKLQETLRVIQARILEEMGQALGEGALVLGQLVAYDDKKERLAVLDAGLQVRGISFAQELVDLTDEALEGFQSVPGQGADPSLVTRVEEINSRCKRFIDKENTFQ